MITDADMRFLRRCVELAREALESGDKPFGSVLVSKEGTIVYEDRNRVTTMNATHHPEFELARWAAANMGVEERSAATVYTSGEHCPMCSAAHGWAGLGRIIYASSSAQLAEWLASFNLPPSPVRSYRIQEIVPGAVVEGPIPELAEEIHNLHLRFHRQSEA